MAEKDINSRKLRKYIAYLSMSSEYFIREFSQRKEEEVIDEIRDAITNQQMPK